MNPVTVRVRIGDAEAEAKGPQRWVSKVIRKFIAQRIAVAKRAAKVTP